MMFLRFSLNLSLYWLHLNMGNFGINIFMTQLLFGAIEIPANLLSMWLLEVFGRRILLIVTLLLGGLACILMVAIPQGRPFVLVWLSKLHFRVFGWSTFVLFSLDYAIAVTSLAVMARLFLIWTNSICNVFMQELVPTTVR